MSEEKKSNKIAIPRMEMKTDKKPRGSGMMWKGMLWVFSADTGRKIRVNFEISVRM